MNTEHRHVCVTGNSYICWPVNISPIDAAYGTNCMNIFSVKLFDDVGKIW